MMVSAKKDSINVRTFSSSHIEFVLIMASLMSLVALTIDAMLPALGSMEQDFGTANTNNIQLVVSIVFLGMAIGLPIFGPLSDAIGRKKTIYVGVGIYLLGTIICLLSHTLFVMLIGRVFQGFGAGSNRIVTMAMIRDRFEGPKMAEILSLIMIIFILVPAIAPSVGQGILFFFPWRAIFMALLVISCLSVVWLSLRQEETLHEKFQRDFSVRNILLGTLETIKHPISRNYSIVLGLVFGSLIGYITSAQKIFQELYQLGDKFPLYFGGLALGVGFSSLLNSQLVKKYKVEKICFSALAIIISLSFLFCFVAYFYQGRPPLLYLMIYLGLTFLFFGMVFANFNSLAIQPLGHIAGIGSSIIGSLQTFLSLIVGSVIGLSYDNSVLPLVLGLFVLNTLALLIAAVTYLRSNHPLITD